MSHQNNWGSSVRTRLTFAMWLKSGNRKGTIACREKAQAGETIVSLEGQRKARMVRAKLPEFQSWDLTSIAAYQWSKCCSALRWIEQIIIHLQGTVVSNQRLYTQSTQPAFCQKDKGRTEYLTVLHLLSHVNAGSPKLMAVVSIRRRSRHNSQMLEVMLKTAIVRWTVTGISCWATNSESLSGWVKGGIVCGRNHQLQGVC